MHSKNPSKVDICLAPVMDLGSKYDYNVCKSKFKLVTAILIS